MPNLTLGPPIVEAIRERHQEALRCASDDHARRSHARSLCQGRGRPDHRSCRSRPPSRPLAAGHSRARQEGAAWRSIRQHLPRPSNMCWTALDLVLVMTVNPGFGGQAFIEAMLPKISQVRDMMRGRNIDLRGRWRDPSRDRRARGSGRAPMFWSPVRRCSPTPTMRPQYQGAEDGGDEPRRLKHQLSIQLVVSISPTPSTWPASCRRA